MAGVALFLSPGSIYSEPREYMLSGALAALAGAAALKLGKVALFGAYMAILAYYFGLYIEYDLQSAVILYDNYHYCMYSLTTAAVLLSLELRLGRHRPDYHRRRFYTAGAVGRDIYRSEPGNQ